MKKILLIFSAVLLTLSLNSQSIIRGNPFPRAIATASGGYCTEYQTVYDAMTTPPSATNAGYQNAMVSDLVDAGYWARMDLFYVFAQETNTASEALINWIDPGTYDATNQHSTAWTTLEGYTGDGANDFIDTEYNPNTNSTHFTQNSGTLGIYNRLDIASRQQYDMGATDGTNQVSMTSNYSDAAYCRINCSTAITGANTNSTGMYIGTRRSATEIEMYRNGSSILSSTSNNSAGIPNTATINILARESNATTRAYYSLNQASIAFVMDAVSDEEATAINTILETYMDAIGKGIQ